MTKKQELPFRPSSTFLDMVAQVNPKAAGVLRNMPVTGMSATRERDEELCSLLISNALVYSQTQGAAVIIEYNGNRDPTRVRIGRAVVQMEPDSVHVRYRAYVSAENDTFDVGVFDTFAAAADAALDAED